MHSHGDDLRASLNGFFSQALALWLVCSDTRLIIGKSIYLTMNTGDSPEITYMTRNVIAEIDCLHYAYIITIAMDAAML